jgi:uncharacterized membrane protein
MESFIEQQTASYLEWMMRISFFLIFINFSFLLYFIIQMKNINNKIQKIKEVLNSKLEYGE